MSTPDEPLRDIAHLGHVELLTPKPDESLWYFTDILGMETVHREGQSAYLRGYGDDATMMLKPTEAAGAGEGQDGGRNSRPRHRTVGNEPGAARPSGVEFAGQLTARKRLVAAAAACS